MPKSRLQGSTGSLMGFTVSLFFQNLRLRYQLSLNPVVRAHLPVVGFLGQIPSLSDSDLSPEPALPTSQGRSSH